MQYHHRSRLPPPPPPPFGRGGGAVYPRGGHKQLYAPSPPPPRRLPLPAPPPPPPPYRRYEVLMEAGRLAAEYLVSTGALPPSSLQRGGGDAWAVPPPPPPAPLPQQLQEPPAFYGRRRYDDAYSNNPATRPRRNNSTSSSSSNRDNHDYSNGGSYNGRGKRKYGEYRRGHLDWGREREQEKGRPASNGRRYEEDNHEEGAPGFRRDPRGSVGNGEARSCVTEEVREATPLMAKAVMQFEMEDILSNAASSNGDVRKDADPQPEVQSENEDSDMEENKVVLSSESEELEQGMDTNGNANTASTIVDMEAEAKPLLDGKVVDEEAEDNGKVLCETSLDHVALDDDMTNLENGLHVDRRSLLEHCDFAKSPKKPRSVRANRKAAIETVDLVSSGETSQMVADEAANGRCLTNRPSDNREDQICQQNTGSSTACNEILEPMLLQENKTSAVTENMRQDREDAQLHVVQESKEETEASPLPTSQQDSSMKENDISPLAASCNDGLMQETNLSTSTGTHEDSVIEETDLSPLIDHHNDSLIEEADLSSLADPRNDSLIEESDLSPLTAYHEVRLMQETDLPQAISLHQDNLNLQFKEGAQICDIGMLPEDVDLIEFSDQKNIVGVELFTNAETIIKMEEEEEGEKLDKSSSFRIHDNSGFGSSVPGSSVEPHKQLQEDFGARAGGNVGGTNNVCHVPLDNNSVQLFDIEDDTQIEVAGFDSSKAKNEIICSSMDGMMHPGIHADGLPVIEDGYNLALSDYLVADIPCYTSMQPDLQASICSNDSQGIPAMDDPIYGSLTDIGFLDVWGQPAEDFEKFF